MPHWPDNLNFQSKGGKVYRELINKFISETDVYHTKAYFMYQELLLKYAELINKVDKL